MSLREMAKSGWYCRIKHNRYGERTKIVFASPDRKSFITFRISGRWYPAIGVFVNSDTVGKGEIGEEDFLKVLKAGVLSSNPTPIAAPETDQELMERVERNIKLRLQGRKKRPKRNLVEKAIQFVA